MYLLGELYADQGNAADAKACEQTAHAVLACMVEFIVLDLSPYMTEMFRYYNSEYRERHPKQEGEQIDWKELRRDTTQKLLVPIHRIVLELARERRKRINSQNPDRGTPTGETQNEYDWKEVLQGIAVAEHLTIGPLTCSCMMCGVDEGRNTPFPGYALRGVITGYDEKKHSADPTFDTPKEDDYVVVLFPFVGDNLLQEPVQQTIVRPLSPREIEAYERGNNIGI